MSLREQNLDPYTRVVTKPELCVSRCKLFRCTQRHLYFKGSVAWCRMVDDECDPIHCKFASCLQHKQLPNGICSLTVKQKEVSARLDDAPKPVKVPSKLMQKIKDVEIY